MSPEPTAAEIAQFMQECDEGKHPLRPEDEAALAKSKERLMEQIRKIYGDHQSFAA